MELEIWNFSGYHRDIIDYYKGIVQYDDNLSKIKKKVRNLNSAQIKKYGFSVAKRTRSIQGTNRSHNGTSEYSRYSLLLDNTGSSSIPRVQILSMLAGETTECRRKSIAH